VNEEVSVKSVATLGSGADAYLHIPNPSTKSQHDLKTSRSSYTNLTNIGCPYRFNLNPVASSSMHQGNVHSVENVPHHQLPSAWFSANSLSPALEVGGGVIYNVYPHPAAGLTPLPVRSPSRVHISSSVDIATTAAPVLKQPEKPVFFQSPHTPVVDHDHLLALAPTRTQAGAKTARVTAPKALDVYEFCDEDDDEFTDGGISFRGRKPSTSVPLSNSADPQPSNHMPCQSARQQPGIYDSIMKCHSISETDAGRMSAPQNVATIFDMDSKAIHRVKTEPVSLSALAADSVPSMEVNSTSLHVTQSTARQRKLSLSGDDADCKRPRLEMSDEEKLMNRLKCNLLEEVPRCQCRGYLHIPYLSLPYLWGGQVLTPAQR